MRTMKKVLALSLVLAMALGMMANAATFNDNDAINPDLLSDINLMIALNVFNENGTGAGYFEPNRELTREEVAKLIYVLKNKGVDNGATSWTGMNIFKDIEPGRWSEGYINYAASVGMMAGTGEGYFNPTAKMSAVEVAKLLLVLNGYKADVQGYLGTNWDVNIIRDAEAAGIFTNYELPVRGSVTREWVARLMNNGINVTKVKYEDGQAVEMYNQNNQAQTFANQDLGLVETVGILTATNNVELDSTPAKNENGKNVLSTLTKDADHTTDSASNVIGATTNFKYDAASGLLGQKVTVLSKGKLDGNAKVYGVTTHSDVNVANTTVDGISYGKISGNTTEANIKVNDVTTKVNLTNDKVEVYIDYVSQGETAWGVVDSTTTKANPNFFGTGIAAGANDNRVVKLVDNDGDGKYDKAFINSVTYGIVSKYNPSKNTIQVSNKTDGTGTGALDVTTESAFKNVIITDTLAKGDVVKITKDYSSGVEKTAVQKVYGTTGTIDKVVNESSITINGTVYKGAANKVGDFDFTALASSTNLTKSKTVYTDGKYVVYEGSKTESKYPENLAMLLGHEAGTGLEGVDRVKVLLNDGTVAIYEYNVPKSAVNGVPFTTVEGTDNDNLSNTTFANPVYEYVISNGKIYFKALGNGADDAYTTVTAETSDSITYTKSKGTIVFDDNDDIKDATALVNDNTVFFVKYEKNGKAAFEVMKKSEIVGSTANTTTAGTILGYSTSNGVNTANVVSMVMDNLPTTKDDSNYYMITGTPYAISENDEVVWEVTAIDMDGTEVTLKISADAALKISKNKVYKANGIEDGITALVSADATLKSAAITGFDEGSNSVVVKTGGTTSYLRTNADTKIVYVNTNSSASHKFETEGSLAVSDNADSKPNILYTVGTGDDADLIKFMLVEINGEDISGYKGTIA